LNGHFAKQVAAREWGKNKSIYAKKVRLHCSSCTKYQLVLLYMYRCTQWTDVG